MTASATGQPGPRTPLRAGAGLRVRREFLIRALVAVVSAGVHLAFAVYGGYGAAKGATIGVPFIVFGSAGVLALSVLSVALFASRAAISGDSYRKPEVTRAKKIVGVCLCLLLAGAVVGLLVGTATMDRRLGTLTGLGMAAVFSHTVDGWWALRRLG